MTIHQNLINCVNSEWGNCDYSIIKKYGHSMWLVKNAKYEDILVVTVNVICYFAPGTILKAMFPKKFKVLTNLDSVFRGI